MKRVVVFITPPADLYYWQPSLEKEFEVAYVSNENSLLPLLLSWRPHVLIYAEPQIREAFLQNTLSAAAHLKMGLFVIAMHYDYRQELLAFQLGADHYLLASTPLHSIKIRLHGIIRKHEENNLHNTRTRDHHSELQNNTVLQVPHIEVHLPEQNMGMPPTPPLHQIESDLLVYQEQNLVHHGGHLTRITPTQMKLLAALIERPGELLSRAWIQKHVFISARMSSRSIDAHIAKLKKAIPCLQAAIINVYGKGYSFNKLPIKKAS